MSVHPMFANDISMVHDYYSRHLISRYIAAMDQGLAYTDPSGVFSYVKNSTKHDVEVNAPETILDLVRGQIQ
jgi:hypothetical protein